MTGEPPDPEDALSVRLIETLVACPEAQLVDWIRDHRAALSVALLQQLKDNHVTASHILADPAQTDRLTRYALTIAGFIAADEPIALAIAQWMRGIWASFNDMAAAVTCFRAALPIYEAMHDERCALVGQSGRCAGGSGQKSGSGGVLYQSTPALSGPGNPRTQVSDLP